MNLPIGTKIIILTAIDNKRVSNRTRNKLHEHGTRGFTVLSEPTIPSFDTKGIKWIRVQSVEENVSLSKWGRPGEKEAWVGWLPLDEIRIKFNDDP